MEHKSVTVFNLEIGYREQNGDATKTIFFLHGNSQSSHAWRKQFAAPELKSYRLIAFDLPAHGSSHFPPEQTISLPGLARLMSDVVKGCADNKPFILVGVSLATNIVAEMLAFDLRPEGVVLAGPSVVGGSYTVEKLIKPGTHVQVVFADEAPHDEVTRYAKETSHSTEAEDLSIFLEEYQAVQKPFRSVLAKSISEGNMSNELALLQQAGVPLLVVFGKDEQIINPDYLDGVSLPLWGSQIFKLPGASHLVNIDQPQGFTTLLAAYAADRFKEYDV